MTTDRLDQTRAALAPLWALKPPGPADLYRHPAFTAFKAFCADTFPAADTGLGFSFGLSDALRSAGLPCLMKGPALPLSLDEGAGAFVRAFETPTVRRTYLCPLDLAGDLPEMRFGDASVRHYTASELDDLFDAPRLARHYPQLPLDSRRLAQFRWLVVEEQALAVPRAGQRAMPFLYETLNRDYGAIEPHAGSHPAAVGDALFGLLLAPWEDWHSLEYDWRAFSIPWIHTASDDLFVRPRSVPSADTLTWEDASHQEYDGEIIEYQRPVHIYLDDEAEVVLAGFDPGWWVRIEAAGKTPLFETPVRHFLLRAAFSDGMDQIMAHMTMIEAALGLRSDSGNSSKPRMTAKGRVAKRVELLLADPKAGVDYEAMFETRSAFVHGRAFQGTVSSKDRNLARSLARRVAVALIDVANGPAGQTTREDYLNSLA